MASLAHELFSELKPGYSFVNRGDNRYEVRTPEGRVLSKAGSHIPLVIAGEASYHAIRRTRSILVQAGAIWPQERKREHEVREVPKHVQAIIPFELAKSTLQDPKSNGRERALAKEVIAQAKKIDAYATLLRRLNERN